MADPDPIDVLIAKMASGGSNNPVVRQGPDGNYYQYDEATNSWKPAEGMPQATDEGQQPVRWEDPNDGSQWLINPSTGQKVYQLSGPIEGHIPGVGVQAPQRPPAQTAAQAQNDQLQNEMLRQKMMSQHETDVREIGNMIARGEIDQAGADRMLALSRANFEASLRGTTPFQEQTQKLNVAGDIMGRRMSTGSSMAQGLLSGASGIYGNILGGQNPPTNFNPLSMAQGFTDQMGGGPEMAELAKAILSGALQGGGL